MKNKNIRFTVARTELLEMLIEVNKPVCYEDIKHRINMDKATFYRNITKFVEEGIVSSFESNNKKSYFEMKMDAHPHFICNYCNSIECIENVSSITLEGYEVESVILKGKCTLCR